VTTPQDARGTLGQWPFDAAPPAPPDSARPRSAGSVLRATAAALLCLLVGLLAVVAVLGVWARGQVLDTDRYVTSVGPLASSAAIQDDVARLISQAIERRVSTKDLGAALALTLAQLPAGTEPPAGLRVPAGARTPAEIAAAITPQLRSTVNRLIDHAAEEFTRSQAFSTLWADLNRAGHEKLVGLLLGNDRPVPGVSVDAGRLLLDLTPAVVAVRQRVETAGLEILRQIPPVSLLVDVADVSGVERAQRVAIWLDRLGAAAPWLAVAAGSLALLAARRRLRMLCWLCLVVALGMGTLWVGLRLVRLAASSRLTDLGASPRVGPIVVDQLTSMLRDGVALVGVGAVAVGGLALVLGAVRSTRRR
jgi:hypothetical protein